MNKRNLLIISNRGFIGKSIFNSLKIYKDYSVYGLNSQNCNLLNLNKTKKTISKIINKPFTIIFLSTFGRFPEDNYSVFNKNIKMITNFLNSINKAFIEQFIFFSSTCLYGRPPKSLPMHENLECIPNSYYGLSKYVSESLIKLQLSCPITIIRIPGVYGELDNNKSIISNFISNINQNKSITIYDKGLVLRDYVYIDDIIKIINKSIYSKLDTTINIATGESIKIIDILNMIQDKLNIEGNINFINSGHTQFNMSFDITNLRNIFPKFTPTNINDGISKIIKIKSKII